MHFYKAVKGFVFFQLFATIASAQVTFPVNGVADKRASTYAFTNATIIKDSKNTIQNATLVIKEGKIVSVGSKINIPAEAIVIDCKGKYIYPSFIDIYTDYGIPAQPRSSGGFNFNAPAQITSNTKGAYGWNQSIRSEINAVQLFSADEQQAKSLRDMGFGTVLTHQKDGIARGTGAVVTLKNSKENLIILKEKASANYSFSRGTSTQSYPQSLMGSIALLRQSFLDGQWYKKLLADPRGVSKEEGINLTLQAWNNNLVLPQIFEANDKWNDLRADRVGDEFGVQFILKGNGNEYQRIMEMKNTKASFILPLNFPQAMDVEDPNEARFIALEELKHWEMAPSNPAAFEKAGIDFCFTTADLKDSKQFPSNLRKAIEYGLSETKALDALTRTPAQLLNIYEETGSIETGKWANFLITDGPVFLEKTNLLQNWVQGERYLVKDEASKSNPGVYNLVVTSNAGVNNYNLEVKNNGLATLSGKDSLAVKYRSDGKLINISFSPVPVKKKAAPQQAPVTTDTTKKNVSAQELLLKTDSLAIASTPDDQMPPKKPVTTPVNPAAKPPLSSITGGPSIRLNGVINGNVMQGNGVDTSGNPLTWTATFVRAVEIKPDTIKKKDIPVMGKLTFPNMAYGWSEAPKQESVIIKNATIWTNEKEGIVQNADLLIENGKIAGIGKNLSASPGVKVIDGTGRHLTPGIIDEHSHIAAASINEGGQSVSSEVRIGDNIAPDDINIYRQLSGGVTSSHILHGSANTIGGQTQLIKLRWGADDNDLKFKGADGFIKFALGENVKRTPSSNNNRFPDTRMGVEQVQVDAFTRAKDYEKALKGADSKIVRRDLELDALVEIMNGKRFITCHSYVQSEIIETMRMAEMFGFKINTFTHILEGYKVADKMKAHGASASTFSDWWAYKLEVQDAIPYNPAIMHAVGVNVAINSDDPEMARRLNQEAAKSVKYARMDEEDALKMVTLNPAKMLHIDRSVGSLKVGKDADVVLWTDNPLSIYAKAEKTLVDGIVYFDREKDLQIRKQIAIERNRIIQKMLGDKKSGGATVPARPSFRQVNACEDHDHNHGILALDDSE
ncbi:MAG: amidohydrolase family protein [Ferruginibacter sp.]